jgi:hypothetical protein
MLNLLYTIWDSTLHIYDQFNIKMSKLTKELPILNMVTWWNKTLYHMILSIHNKKI